MGSDLLLPRPSGQKEEKAGEEGGEGKEREGEGEQRKGMMEKQWLASRVGGTATCGEGRQVEVVGIEKEWWGRYR